MSKLREAIDAAANDPKANAEMRAGIKAAMLADGMSEEDAERDVDDGLAVVKPILCLGISLGAKAASAGFILLLRDEIAAATDRKNIEALTRIWSNLDEVLLPEGGA